MSNHTIYKFTSLCPNFFGGTIIIARSHLTDECFHDSKQIPNIGLSKASTQKVLKPLRFQDF